MLKRAFGIGHLDLFKRDVPHGKQKVISACGHAPQEECEEEVNDTLLTFLSSLSDEKTAGSRQQSLPR
jgi:pimeloyl-ACP methyl ester carboxylesterase